MSHNWSCQVHTDSPKRQKSTPLHTPYIHTHDPPQNDLSNTQIPNIPLHTQKRAFSRHSSHTHINEQQVPPPATQTPNTSTKTHPSNMLDENMGAAHRGLPRSWPPGWPRCPSVPGRPLDDLHSTPSGEASNRPDEGEVVRGGADQSRADQINQMQQLSHTNQPRETEKTQVKSTSTPQKVSDRWCTPKKTRKSENIILHHIVENVMAVIVRQKSALKSTSKHMFFSISHFSLTHIVSHNWYC